MISCNHDSCGREKRVWLPTVDSLSEIALHPWCKHCGLVKNISDDRAHRLGYWMNILSQVANHFSLKEVQKHLIAKHLESHDCFDDVYSVTGSTQREVFVKTVSRICGLSERSVDSLVC